MKTRLVPIALAITLSVSLGFVHPFGNPRVERSQGLNTLLVHATIPNQAKQILIEKCADCHSNETRWPIYSRLAPGSWLIERDIVEARKKMNLSLWDEMSMDDREQILGKIIHEAKSGEMPPPQYRLLHWSAQITPAELPVLQSMQPGGVLQEGTTPSDGDPTRGKAVFQKRCTGCHALESSREGPPLGSVFGRKAGSVAGFDYSVGLKKSGITWDETSLERWLSDPDMVVPDTKMDFQLPKAQERSDIIAYFKQKK